MIIDYYYYYGMMMMMIIIIIIIIIITRKKLIQLYKIKKIIIFNTYVRKLDTHLQASENK